MTDLLTASFLFAGVVSAHYFTYRAMQKLPCMDNVQRLTRLEERRTDLIQNDVVPLLQDLVRLSGGDPDEEYAHRPQ